MGDPNLSAPPRDGKLLRWLIKNPQQAAAYMRRVQQLSNQELVLTDAQGVVTRSAQRFGQLNTTIEAQIRAPEDTPDQVVTTGGDVFGPNASGFGNIAVFGNGSGKLIRDSGTKVTDVDPRGRHSVWIPATLMRPSVAGGSAAIASTATSGPVDIASLDFDPTSAEYAQFAIVLPETWNAGTLTAKFVWSHPATTVDFGVVWSIQALARMDAEDISAALSAAILTADTGGQTNYNYESPETDLITPTGTKAKGATLYFRIGRLPSDPADTLAVDAKLIGVRLFFISDVPNEGGEPVPIVYEPEVVNWMNAIANAGGALASNSALIANNLMVHLNAASYRSKIKWLLPLLGADLIAARMPLIDSLAVGIATNNGFLAADFTQPSGLTGNGSKYLGTGIAPTAIGTGGNGGVGVWVLTIGSGSAFLGARNAGAGQLFGVVAYASDQFMYWGDGSSVTSAGAAGVAAHYYGQRVSATSRALYRNGAQVAADTDNSPAGGIGAASNFILFGWDPSFVTNGRLGCGYLTDGTMTAGEVAAFHTLLNTYLHVAAGR